MFTIPESATDSCEDSEGDLHPKPASARNVDVDLSGKVDGTCVFLATVEFRHVELAELLEN